MPKVKKKPQIHAVVSRFGYPIGKEIDVYSPTANYPSSATWRDGGGRVVGGALLRHDEYDYMERQEDGSLKATPRSSVGACQYLATISCQERRREGVMPFLEVSETTAARVKDNMLCWKLAWVHNLLYKTTLTEEDLLEFGLPVDLVEQVSLMTRRPDQRDVDYLSGIAQHPIARRVKVESIIQEMSYSHSADFIRLQAPRLVQLTT